MHKIFLDVFNEGISPKEMNAVRGGAADPLCVCANGALFDCGCYADCICNGKGSSLVCSCNSTTADNKPIEKPERPTEQV